jgi:hypothetical protein
MTIRKSSYVGLYFGFSGDIFEQWHSNQLTYQPNPRELTLTVKHTIADLQLL